MSKLCKHAITLSNRVSTSAPNNVDRHLTGAGWIVQSSHLLGNEIVNE